MRIQQATQLAARFRPLNVRRDQIEQRRRELDDLFVGEALGLQLSIKALRHGLVPISKQLVMLCRRGNHVRTLPVEVSHPTCNLRANTSKGKKCRIYR